MTLKCRSQSHVRPVLLWTSSTRRVLHRIVCAVSAREPSKQRCNLTHDEAFDKDAALQLKLVLGIPAQLQDQPFPVAQTVSRPNLQRNDYFYVWEGRLEKD